MPTVLLTSPGESACVLEQFPAQMFLTTRLVLVCAMGIALAARWRRFGGRRPGAASAQNRAGDRRCKRPHL